MLWHQYTKQLYSICNYTVSTTIHKPISASFCFVLVTDMENTKSNYVVCLFKTLPHNCFAMKPTVRDNV